MPQPGALRGAGTLGVGIAGPGRFPGQRGLEQVPEAPGDRACTPAAGPVPALSVPQPAHRPGSRGVGWGGGAVSSVRAGGRERPAGTSLPTTVRAPWPSAGSWPGRLLLSHAGEQGGGRGWEPASESPPLKVPSSESHRPIPERTDSQARPRRLWKPSCLAAAGFSLGGDDPQGPVTTPESPGGRPSFMAPHRGPPPTPGSSPCTHTLVFFSF